MPVGLPHELGASHSGDGLEHVGEMWPGTEAHRLGKRFQGRSTFPVVFEKYPASLLDAELCYEVTEIFFRHTVHCLRYIAALKSGEAAHRIDGEVGVENFLSGLAELG